ncbi:MAG TPA: hypothetical protein VMW81_05175 [Nitrospinota bacterium]|nr:hypothetical protein [Nitrospinota bacterium]
MYQRFNFDKNSIDLAKNTLDDAAALTRNYYDINTKDWKGIKYDLKTLEDLKKDEITDNAFAQLSKYRGVSGKASQGFRFNFFRICIQDHKIMEAVKKRGDRTCLKPLLLYVMTHELIHIVRFNRLIKKFEGSSKEKEIEEKNVHFDTYNILRNTEIHGMNDILNHYRDFRFIEN